ncbi:MAG: phosphate ABC transporter permease PstA [Deltaproteobacteria bacterium]|nr:phosphate ABC transporter permease PstA [Deltaproteobacteria bacterium]
MISCFSDNAKKRFKLNSRFCLIITVTTIFTVLMLITMLLNIINGAFGFVAIANTIEPQKLVGFENFDALEKEELIQILESNLSKGLIRRYNFEEPFTKRSKNEIITLVIDRIIEPRIVKSWNLKDSILKKGVIKQYIDQNFPEAHLEFRAWLRPGLLLNTQSSIPEKTGLRTAILGSIMIILITLIFAFPIGVGAAIYLEEYAKDNRFTRFIQLNIYNLSGVPSIIYGLLGLAIFVRGMKPITSGAIFGYGDPSTTNGRTIIAAGLTMAILILPIIIINTQEALRAIPRSRREAGYGLGGTKWQIIWFHLLPGSIDRIMTGTILAISRAIGETAPIVVIGASTFITVDPSSIFSKFTTLPIQIYQWTARPQPEFRNVAAAAILVLLILLLAMNSFAIITRNKINKNWR